MANRKKLTARRRALFVAELRKHGNVTRAADAIGMNRAYVYELRGRPELADFVNDWDNAVAEFEDGVESELLRRAVVGVPRPVFYLGKPCGSVQEFSDRLLQFWLERRRYPPTIRQELSTPAGPIGVKHQTWDLSKLSYDELAELRRLHEKAGASDASARR